MTLVGLPVIFEDNFLTRQHAKFLLYSFALLRRNNIGGRLDGVGEAGN